jgi:hypothetical protein
VLPPLTAARFQLSGQLDFSTVTHDPDRQVVLTTAGRPLLIVPVEAGLAIKNPPKNPPKKTHLKNPTNNFLGGFFKLLIFYENNTNFSL